ncbi:protein YIPF2 [Eudromia elegans]
MDASERLRFPDPEEPSEPLPGPGTRQSREAALDMGLGEEGEAEDTAELLAGQKQPRSFWSFEFYQTLFDVDTPQVLERIRGSVLPGKNFVRHRLRNNPDLYGPFWICVTLALALAISSHLSHVLNKRAAPTSHSGSQIHRATVAATLVFGYVGLAPLALWGFLRWRPGSRSGSYSLLETVSAYGYSLAACIPATVLAAIPAAWLQWLLLVVAALLPASVLALTFRAPGHGPVPALALPLAVVTLHMLLAVTCKRLE